MHNLQRFRILHNPLRCLARAAAVGLALALLLMATPAAACGCGGYIARDGDARVAQERALLRWDGVNEDVVLSFAVPGASSGAAWIPPGSVTGSRTTAIRSRPGWPRPWPRTSRRIGSISRCACARAPGRSSRATSIRSG